MQAPELAVDVRWVVDTETCFSLLALGRWGSAHEECFFVALGHLDAVDRQVVGPLSGVHASDQQADSRLEVSTTDVVVDVLRSVADTELSAFDVVDAVGVAGTLTVVVMHPQIPSAITPWVSAWQANVLDAEGMGNIFVVRTRDLEGFGTNLDRVVPHVVEHAIGVTDGRPKHDQNGTVIRRPGSEDAGQPLDVIAQLVDILQEVLWVGVLELGEPFFGLLLLKLTLLECSSKLTHFFHQPPDVIVVVDDVATRLKELSLLERLERSDKSGAQNFSDTVVMTDEGGGGCVVGHEVPSGGILSI